MNGMSGKLYNSMTLKYDCSQNMTEKYTMESRARSLRLCKYISDRNRQKQDIIRSLRWIEINIGVTWDHLAQCEYHNDTCILVSR